MEAAVHGWAHQFVEAGVHKHEAVGTGVLDGAHLGQQHGAFGDEVAAGLQLQRQRVADQTFRLPACGVPEAEVVVDVDAGIALAVGDRQAAAGRDRVQVVAGLDGLLHQAHHRLADLGQMAVVHARADVHVQAHELQAVAADGCQRGAEVGVPDAVLAVLAAGVGLVAVAVAEAGVDAQPHGMAGRGRTELLQHVDGAGVHRDVVLDDGGQRRVVQQVRRKHDLVATRLIARGQRPQDLAA